MREPAPALPAKVTVLVVFVFNVTSHTCFDCFALHNTTPKIYLWNVIIIYRGDTNVVLALAYGSPVGVENAGNRRFPKSCAKESNSPLYQDKWNGWSVRFAKMWADKRLPRTRIVVSNTCGLVSTSKVTQSITFRTALSNPGLSSSTTKVSKTSISVREKLPATSLDAKLALVLVNPNYNRQREIKTHGLAQSGPCPEQERGVNCRSFG